MRWMPVKPALALFLFAAAGPALAQDDAPLEPKLTVQGLMEDCRKSHDTDSGIAIGGDFCLGYLSGVADHLKSLGASDPSAGICGEISYGKIVQVFLNWTADHRGRWNDSRLTGAVDSLQEAWPCPAK
jgi:hypothetical protein